MVEYEVQPNTRKCAKSGRVLQPGETVYTVLAEESGKLVRKDYAEENWQGAPEGCFSHWKGKVKETATTKKSLPMDESMLMDCFERLEGQDDPKQQNFRYIIGLMLVRKRKLKLLKTENLGDMERLVLRCQKTNTNHEILHTKLTENELDKVQEEVLGLLGWE
ncbi:MAG: hypothetical protein RIR17_1798 [Planctomycetota bacterium]|jgi:hypothetical protein|nr:hypothetical protein [bacterium]